MIGGLLWYAGAAVAEIAGCFAFWAVIRQGASRWWLGPGVLSLILFAWSLTQVESAFAGRAYAAYGGIYVAAALIWGMVVEGVVPDRWDLLGVALCLAGTTVILFGQREG